MTSKNFTRFTPAATREAIAPNEDRVISRERAVDAEAEGTPADGDVLREAIFHESAMEPMDDLPGA